jgi:Fic family protein
VLEKVLHKHAFWNKHATEAFNPRQTKLLNRLLDGFTGNLTTSKWAKIAKCSSDTALRDIQHLVNKNRVHFKTSHKTDKLVSCLKRQDDDKRRIHDPVRSTLGRD